MLSDLPSGSSASIASEWEETVADISIRNLEDSVRDRLRVRAASHGRSMESEVRVILTQAVTETQERPGLVRVLADRFSELGGIDLEIPDRTSPVRGADFSQ